MSAYHRNVLVERFRAGGGELPHTVVVGIGAGWYEDIKELRRRGCFVERDGDLWRMDLDTVPEREPVDVGGAGGDALLSRVLSEGGSPDAAASSPDTDPDPQVEGETVPLFEAPAKAASPYDPNVEAA